MLLMSLFSIFDDYWITGDLDYVMVEFLLLAVIVGLTIFLPASIEKNYLELSNSL